MLNFRKHHGCYFGHRNPIRAVVVAAALGGVSLGALASPSEYSAFMDLASGAGKHTVTHGGSGTPLTTRPTTGALPRSVVGNMNFAHEAAGWPSARGGAYIPSPIPGKGVEFAAKQAFTKASTAKAVARFAFGMAGPIGVGLSIYWTLKDLDDISHSYNSSTGKNEFFRETMSGSCDMTGASNPQTWCSGNFGSSGSWVLTSMTATHCFGHIQCASGQRSAGESAFLKLQSATLYPMTEAELADRIAAESGWPTTDSGGTSFSQTVAEAMNSGLAEPLVKEGNLTLTPPVSPTSISGAPKVTTASDGSTKTETMTCEWTVPLGMGTAEYRCTTSTTTYTPPKVTTDTVVTTKPDGTTETSTVTKTTPGGTSTTATTGQEDTKDERSECEKSPNTLGCAELDTPSGTIPKSTATLSYAEEDLFGSGSCPANATMASSVLGQTVTVWDWQKTCELAIPLRALVVALATFAAFLIVMPGGRAAP